MDADFKIAWQDQMIALSGIKLLPQGGIPASWRVSKVCSRGVPQKRQKDFTFIFIIKL